MFWQKRKAKRGKYTVVYAVRPEMRWTPETGKWWRSVVSSSEFQILNAGLEATLVQDILNETASTDYVDGWKACMSMMATMQSPTELVEDDTVLPAASDSSSLQFFEETA